ncbi:uncharacterized protein LOC122016020 isoform X1 [Zingiber officinale]|uniref:uncharacterized protein LOC122016020 isoform X1 n=1 Tax=Zingiber officinale TaxID=94328 RepID=UPI001C4AB5BC|nr:uncharacterized protein LOC122016020 isoform X1 [Zingiber officinale]
MAALRDCFLCPVYRLPSPFRSTPVCRRRRFSSSVVSVGGDRQRRSQNVEGDFFVDQLCIDCDTCRWMAPEMFTRVGAMSAVTKQPISEEEKVMALQALICCPTNSIHTEKPTKKIIEVHKMFPLPIDAEKLPGVYHCGYHSERSYGATSYLITHPEGNILVDSPRFTERLAKNIENLGGARYMFLTHKDDIGDHEKWSKRLRCERILHSGDVEFSTTHVEIKLDGEGPWSIGTDFELIYTPGHTEGSVCLHYKPLKVMFTGDHLFRSEGSDLSISVIYNQQSVSLQLKSIQKLLDFDFEWILPGHGRRVAFRSNQHKNVAIQTFLASQEPLYSGVKLWRHGRSINLHDRAIYSGKMEQICGRSSASIVSPRISQKPCVGLIFFSPFILPPLALIRRASS